MQIKQIYTDSPLRNFSYLISIDDYSQNICLDPFYPDQIIQGLKGPLTFIVNTHEHRDHTCGNKELVEKFQPQVLCHPGALSRVPCSTKGWSEGERIEFSSDTYLEALDTPGHTMSHLCILAVKAGKPFAIFTGDTLFNAGVGNCHNGGDPEILYETISKKFGSLNDDIMIFPGHDYWENNLAFTREVEAENPYIEECLNEYQSLWSQGEFLVSTLELERKVNAFLRLGSGQIRSYLVKKFGEAQRDDPEKWSFLKLRELRNKW